MRDWMVRGMGAAEHRAQVQPAVHPVEIGVVQQDHRNDLECDHARIEIMRDGDHPAGDHREGDQVDHAEDRDRLHRQHQLAPAIGHASPRAAGCVRGAIQRRSSQ